MPFPGIFRITCPTPFSGLPHVHIYVAEGPQGGLVLFDTAMPYEDSFDRVVSSLEWLGRKLTDIEAIYLTMLIPITSATPERCKRRRVPPSSAIRLPNAH